MSLPFDFETLKNRQILVLGAAKSGVAAAAFLQAQGASVLVSDYAQIEPDLKSELDALGIAWEEGGHQQTSLEAAEGIVVSPGIPLTAPPLRWAEAHHVPVISEIELASHFIRCPVIAVTGSNGKTTTVTLLTELLQASGYRVGCGGNIGTPLISLVADDYDYLVVEISSFQLETTYHFAPDIALLLNLYPNHLNRHASMEAYFEIKSRLFQAQEPSQHAILNQDNAWSIRLKDQLQAQVHSFSTEVKAEQQAYLEEDKLYALYHGMPKYIISRADLGLTGQHNLENYLAVLAVASLLTLETQIIRQVFSTFAGVAHRLEFVRDLAGRSFINDSKATNYLATQKALESLNAPIVLIAGGEDKGGDFEPLAQAIQERVKTICLIGEAKADFARWLRQRGYNQIREANGLEEAVDFALAASAVGDIILLSPACASYDMFKNFEERGDVFKAYVARLTLQNP